MKIFYDGVWYRYRTQTTTGGALELSLDGGGRERHFNVFPKENKFGLSRRFGRPEVLQTLSSLGSTCSLSEWTVVRK